MTASRTDPIRVLLVDDSEEFIRAAGLWIESQPSLRLVASARNGEEAIEAVGAETPDLVLIDAFMPVLSGFEATRRIKSRAGAPLVLILSVHEGSAMEQEAWAAGADGFLPKPELATRLPEWIRERTEPGRGTAGNDRRPRLGTDRSLTEGGEV